MPRLLYFWGKDYWYPLNRRLGGPQSHSGCSGKEKNSQIILLCHTRKFLTTCLAIMVHVSSFVIDVNAKNSFHRH
jgi:hypothetical protein